MHLIIVVIAPLTLHICHIAVIFVDTSTNSVCTRCRMNDTSFLLLRFLSLGHFFGFIDVMRHCTIKCFKSAKV